MKRIGLLFITAFASVACAGSQPVTTDTNTQSVDTQNPGLAATGTMGMVVSAHPAASRAGAKVLGMGGSAVDAAIAVQFALNVVEPQNSGIGGGGFMMVYDAKTHEVTIVDGRERAPATANPRMFLGADGTTPIPFATRQTLGIAVGVPGTLMAIQAAHQRWGKLEMKELVQPGIQLAEEGVPVNFVLAFDINAQKSKLLLDPTASSVFVPAGVPLVEGDLLVQGALASTLRSIRNGGIESFYSGAIGQSIIAAVAARGGSMTMDDLSGYTLTFDPPIHGTWRGYDVAAMPPPSSGGVTTLQILKLAELKNIASHSFDSTLRYHILTEAMHLAFADRGKFIGDPELDPRVPAAALNPIAGMLNDDYLASRAALINLAAANASVIAGNPLPYDPTPWPVSNDTFTLEDVQTGETTQIVVADREGNLVTWTTTIEQAFGTGIMVPGYGFFLNNEVTDFNATPTGPNQAAPRRRPMSSMGPMILFDDGKPILALGSSGGPRIIAAVAQVVQNRFDFSLGLQDAIDKPRMFSSAFPTIQYGSGFPAAAISGLTALGHTLAAAPAPPGFLGAVQAIEIDATTGVYLGVADSRRQGAAIGLDHVPSGQWR